MIIFFTLTGVFTDDQITNKMAEDVSVNNGASCGDFEVTLHYFDFRVNARTTITLMYKFFLTFSESMYRN